MEDSGGGGGGGVRGKGWGDMGEVVSGVDVFAVGALMIANTSVSRSRLFCLFGTKRPACGIR